MSEEGEKNGEEERRGEEEELKGAEGEEEDTAAQQQQPRPAGEKVAVGMWRRGRGRRHLIRCVP